MASERKEKDKSEGMQVKLLRRMKNVKEGFSTSLRSLQKGRAAAAATENKMGDYPSPFSAKLIISASLSAVFIVHCST